MAQMLVVLCLSGLLMPIWINSVTEIESKVKLISQDYNQDLFSGIMQTTELFSIVNASSINLATILSSSLNDINDLHNFSKIESMVGPPLFQAFSIIPNLSQISYIGLDGLLFAYYKEGNQTHSLYSNSTFSNDYTLYVQLVIPISGKPYGDAVKSPPSAIVNSSWFQQALKSRNGYASVGRGWSSSNDTMLHNSVALNGVGAISLGLSMAPLINLLNDRIAFYKGSLYLATMDGYVVAKGFSNARMIFDGIHISFELLGQQIDCHSKEGKLRGSILSIRGKTYVINCSPTEIAGVKFVYVLGLPENEFLCLIRKSITISFVLLILMVVGVVAIICIFLFVIGKAARREMHLSNSLIKQMEATQQSERKSMNKSLAFASASHDIRASLAGIDGLVQMCIDDVSKRDPSRSELLPNLLQVKECNKDLKGILNSVLDTSKIEAGKIQLEEEEFEMGQLLEDVVDLYHPVGMKKGVDVILDPYDGSILKSCHVKGDRGKLKQILSNLVSNAVKFTSEGHIEVRAWAAKPSQVENNICASDHRRSTCCCLLFKIGREHSAEVNGENGMIRRDLLEFVFEVNDTGKGIPKEMQKSVFENYVQVRETSAGQEGTGLGLGIVQSLIRLMGGEIAIVDKEEGERGTCFRFNVFLNSAESRFSRNNSRTSDIESIHHSDLITRIQSPKSNGSQAILFIESNRRSNVVHSFMRRLGIKIHVVSHHQQLSTTLKRIIRNQALSHSSSGKSERNSRISDGAIPLSALDGSDSFSTPLTRFVLIVIDTRAGPFREITRAVAEFRRDASETWLSRVVWLDNNKNLDGLNEEKLPPTDVVISRPFHGSRLYQTIKLLPEFGGGQIPHNVRSSGPVSPVCEIVEVRDEPGPPLMGKRILIADDNPIGRRIALHVVKQLGADIVSCENGAAALKLVRNSLNNSSPFDCILMDCEMVVMDGREATARIREEEKDAGVRTPIIALTAHTKGEEIEGMIQAGVDAYITKPLTQYNLLQILSQQNFRLSH